MVPIWNAVAPTIINSTASFQFTIPPMPIIGISTFLEISRTLASATGLMAGPDKPPVIFLIFGFLEYMSNEVPIKVFIADTASPPFVFTTFA